jgi:hypothetical protein
MKPQPLNIGDIVQINPDAGMFGACLMIITEPKDWGAQGYIRVPGKEGGNAFFRCKYENMELVGKAEWIRVIDEEVQ